MEQNDRPLYHHQHPGHNSHYPRKSTKQTIENIVASEANALQASRGLCGMSLSNDSSSIPNTHIIPRQPAALPVSIRRKTTAGEIGFTPGLRQFICIGMNEIRDHMIWTINKRILPLPDKSALDKFHLYDFNVPLRTQWRKRLEKLCDAITRFIYLYRPSGTGNPINAPNTMPLCFHIEWCHFFTAICHAWILPREI